MTSKIEWTDETWNPVAERFWGERKFTDVQYHPERLDDPLHWRKPRKVFVNSMSDLFHPAVPFDFIQMVFHTMKFSPDHTFQILTKRPETMHEFMGWVTSQYVSLPNVWLGVSVEDQKAADERVPWLLKTPATIRFVSYEPALGPVKYSHTNSRLIGQDTHSSLWEQNTENWLTGETYILQAGGTDHLIGRGAKIDWVIAGGETGPGARPAHPDWFRSVRDQCQAAGVPFFFKQWGEWVPVFETEWKRVNKPNGMFEHIGRKKAGRLLDGREWNEYPEARQ